MVSCEKEDHGVLESQGVSPIISGLSISPSRINTDTINVGPTRLPGDILDLASNAFARVQSSAGVNAISRVEYWVRNHDGSAVLSSGLLLDNGVLPDVASGDSIFSGTMQFQIVRSTIGTLFVEVASEGTGSYHSNSLFLPLEIVRANQPPVLSNLLAPDTILVGANPSFLITIRASDPDGLPDIRSVIRTTPSNLVLPLNDSGVNGDQQAGDGIYSETVSLDPPPPAGAYDFTFQAFDRSNVGSNIINKRITVVQ